CLVCGFIELVGSLIAERIRRLTPRAALLSTLAGIAISFIAIDFAIRTFAAPLVALVPLGMVLTTYFARAKMPFRIPGGACALALGTGAAWILAAADPGAAPVALARVTEAKGTLGVYLPVPLLGDLWAGATHPLAYQFLVPVMLPMGLFNVLG